VAERTGAVPAGTELTGKVAVVTGAGSGIGRASAERFAAAGARVVAVDLGADSAAATAHEVEGIAVAGDVSDPDLWLAVRSAADDLGGMDVIHLNAGVYGHTGPIDELPDDVYERVVAANIGGVVLGTRAAVATMRGRGGSIVATASLAGLVPFPPNPVYTATKHAVTGFVRAMAPTLEPDRITINAVCPGVVDTPMTVGAAGGLDPSAIADVVFDLATGGRTGHCMAVWSQGEPVAWSFSGPDQLVSPTDS
jgi:NAD(P)-dependent dehydrogenase (short-subunit alcohol dehydrogenase family)